MNKYTLKFREYPNHIKDYALMSPPAENEYWEFIFENISKKEKYLKHFVRTEFIINEDLPNYKPKDIIGWNNKQLSLPRGTLIYYIDLYTDKK